MSAAPHEIHLSPSDVPVDPAGIAALVQARLSAMAGEGFRPISLALDFGPGGGTAMTAKLEAWVDRRTRSLAFVRAKLMAPDGQMIAAGSAVFSRPPDSA